MNTTLDIMVAYGMGHHSKYHIAINKKFLLFLYFFALLCTYIVFSNVPIILDRATIRLFLLAREQESPKLASLNLYVTLNEIHGNL